MTTTSRTRAMRTGRGRALLRASDETLLLRYRDKRDSEAFSELVHRYEQELYNYLRRYLSDDCLAEDAFQVTFLQVHLKARLYEEGRAFRPWLYTIATHQAIDLIRKTRRHRPLSLDGTQAAHAEEGALVNCLESPTPGPVAQLEEKEQREWAWRAVKALPSHLRNVVILICYRGMEYRKVAELLQIPVGTVKTRVHTARGMLNAAWRRVAC